MECHQADLDMIFLKEDSLATFISAATFVLFCHVTKHSHRFQEWTSWGTHYSASYMKERDQTTVCVHSVEMNITWWESLVLFTMVKNWGLSQNPVMGAFQEGHAIIWCTFQNDLKKSVFYYLMPVIYYWKWTLK